MRISLAAATVWRVPPEDEKMARRLLAEQPSDVILDYIIDAQHSIGGNFSTPVTEAEELED